MAIELLPEHYYNAGPKANQTESSH